MLLHSLLELFYLNLRTFCLLLQRNSSFRKQGTSLYTCYCYLEISFVLGFDLFTHIYIFFQKIIIMGIHSRPNFFVCFPNVSGLHVRSICITYTQGGRFNLGLNFAFFEIWWCFLVLHSIPLICMLSWNFL